MLKLVHGYIGCPPSQMSAAVSESINTKKSHWDKIPDQTTIFNTMQSLKGRGINATIVQTKEEEALQKLSGMIPDGSEVMTAGSETLKQIGFIELLKSGKHRWKNLKDQILEEKDPVKQLELRKRATNAEYFVGSVHAVAETGEIIAASAAGSQIPSYAYSSNNVIWIVGAQKIVSNLEEGLRRVREYAYPLEDKRMKSVGYPGSVIGKILITEREVRNGRASLIFVNEKLGF